MPGGAQITALDEAGKPVDWWFAYKVPKLTKDAESDSATGYEYAYFDPSYPELVQSPHLLTDEAGAVKATLAALFSDPDAGWILYNDERPPDVGGADSGADGHTKGILGFDVTSGTGLWLLHSWPKYPDAVPAPTAMPTPIYGQTFLCLSLNLATLEQIAAQMVDHQVPQVYNSRMPDALPQTSPLRTLAAPLDPNPAGDSNVIDCKTVGGMPFKVIAKNRGWGRDFWNDLVGPTLGADMDVETWIRGKIPPTLDSDGIHKTFDVKYVDLAPLGIPFTWPETHDHAKWGVTVTGGWVCVGDINRMVSQEKRGGGTIAFQNDTLWSNLQKIDLLVAPPGHSRVDAAGLVQATHAPPASAA